MNIGLFISVYATRLIRPMLTVCKNKQNFTLIGKGGLIFVKNGSIDTNPEPRLKKIRRTESEIGAPDDYVMVCS